ncbi:anthranilate synthase component 1 [Thalassotalea fusca]
MKSMFAQSNLTPGAVNTLSGSAKYQSDPLAVFQHLTKGQANALLLESAEIDKKHELKSLLLVDAAARIECNGNKVTFEPLTTNGEAALEFVKDKITQHAEITILQKGFTATFHPVNNELDERSRLLATNQFSALRTFLQLQNDDQHDFGIFLGGTFAFDMMSMSEVLPAVSNGENTCPDYVYYLAETLVIIDHEKRSSEIVGNVFSGSEQQKCYFEISRRLSEIKTFMANFSADVDKNSADALINAKHNHDNLTVSVDVSDEDFCQTVEQLKEHIKAGDIFQVVPSRTFSLPCTDTFAAYAALKRSNPSPYMFYLQDREFCMFGASPESALKFQHTNRQVEVYPIAGTRPRGFTANGEFSPDLDSRLELDLRQDQKELAEHIMLVDLARNDIARVSKAGTRHVADLLKVDRYSHVMHLVSRVCGTLADELDALHAYQACMNMGTLSGAPKVRATELIRQFEGKRRGSYGGAVGYLTGSGDMDTCIVIRSAFVKNRTAFIQAGAGVVYDSNPQAEANETRQKAQAVISAIQLSESIIAEKREGAK